MRVDFSKIPTDHPKAVELDSANGNHHTLTETTLP
jgi:hypothetical protein